MSRSLRQFIGRSILCSGVVLTVAVLTMLLASPIRPAADGAPSIPCATGQPPVTDPAAGVLRMDLKLWKIHLHLAWKMGPGGR
jgi:hypothetical protein